MRSIVFAGVAALVVAVAQPSAAQDRRIDARIGDATVVLVVPPPFCPLDPSNPSDARMLSVMRQAQAGQNHVLVQFAECTQLEAWRTGKRKVLDDMGGATTPIRYATQTLPYTRAQLISNLARVYKRKGGALLQGTTDTVNRRMGAVIKNMKINETKFLGVLHEDEKALYFGLVQALRTEFGDTKVQVGVTGITLLRGKMVSFSVYTPAVGENSASEALATARGIMEKTIAANGG